MTPEMRTQLEIFQADMIADYLAVNDAKEASERKVRAIREGAEVTGLVLILSVGIICLITGFAGLAADLVMIVPNAGMLLYRHLRDI